MVDFLEKGYLDITDKYPIRQIERFEDHPDLYYAYTKRYYKKDNNIHIILKVGIYNNSVDISGICILNNTYYKFELHEHVNHIEEMFNETINAVKNKLIGSGKYLTIKNL